MVDSENSSEQQLQHALKSSEAQPPKEIIASKVSGTVKWFNVKSGYGFINRNDTKEDVFVHQTAIVKNNPKKAVRSVGDGEVVQFDVVIGEKGNEAANVTGPDGEPVRGSPYAADKRRGFRRLWKNKRNSNSKGEDDGAAENGEVNENGNEKVRKPQRRFRPRYNRGGYVAGNGRTRNNQENVNENGEPVDSSSGEDNLAGQSRGRGGARRFFRRNFRAGPRGNGQRPRNDGEEGGNIAPRGPPRRGGNNRLRRNAPRKGNNINGVQQDGGHPVQNTTAESSA